MTELQNILEECVLKGKLSGYYSYETDSIEYYSHREICRFIISKRGKNGETNIEVPYKELELIFEHEYQDNAGEKTVTPEFALYFYRYIINSVFKRMNGSVEFLLEKCHRDMMDNKSIDDQQNLGISDEDGGNYV